MGHHRQAVFSCRYLIAPGRGSKSIPNDQAKRADLMNTIWVGMYCPSAIINVGIEGHACYYADLSYQGSHS